MDNQEADNKQWIAQALNIKYIIPADTVIGDSDAPTEVAKIRKIEVKEVSSMAIELQIEYVNPFAVS